MAQADKITLFGVGRLGICTGLCRELLPVVMFGRTDCIASEWDCEMVSTPGGLILQRT